MGRITEKTQAALDKAAIVVGGEAYEKIEDLPLTHAASAYYESRKALRQASARGDSHARDEVRIAARRKKAFEELLASESGAIAETLYEQFGASDTQETAPEVPADEMAGMIDALVERDVFPALLSGARSAFPPTATVSPGSSRMRKAAALAANYLGLNRSFADGEEAKRDTRRSQSERIGAIAGELLAVQDHVDVGVSTAEPVLAASRFAVESARLRVDALVNQELLRLGAAEVLGSTAVTGAPEL